MAFGPGASAARPYACDVKKYGRFANRPYFMLGAAAGDRSGNTSFGIALWATRGNSRSAWNTCT